MLIHDARDPRRMPASRPLAPSPTRFTGEFATLFEDSIEPNLPSPDAVARFHAELAAYVRDPSALLLVRYVRGMDRGVEYTTAGGTRLKATDNSPAWWVHFALLQDGRITPGAFGRVIATMPTHLFEVGRAMPGSASASGWHVAHLFTVKDGNTDFGAWRRADAIGRSVRSVHPCNHFLLPMTNWAHWGADARVLAFVAERYASRYADVWEEFVRLARADPAVLGRVTGSIPVHVSAEDPAARGRASAPTSSPPSSREGAHGRTRATYRATRLLFRREVIDALTPSSRGPRCRSCGRRSLRMAPGRADANTPRLRRPLRASHVWRPPRDRRPRPASWPIPSPATRRTPTPASPTPPRPCR